MRYDCIDCQSFRDDDKGPERMANFVAKIAEEIRIVDGMNTRTVLRINGEMPAPRESPSDPIKSVPLPMIEVDAEEFTGLGWVMKHWGARCVISPGNGIKDDLRAMIQLHSDPKPKTVYRHTGWTTLPNGRPAYIHAGGAISAKGNDPAITVMLPPELQKYRIETPESPAGAWQAALSTLDLANKEITWPLLAAAFSPLFGPVDFGIHLAGRTGTFKSECISLFQSLYGSALDARNLPGSWSSTANALEAQAFLAKNAAFVIDDFVPQGTSWQVRSYQQNADKIIRAQGNQAGRARLTDTSNLQPTMYPRGIILSTGEDVPEGHSVRARLLILELSPGDVSTKMLTHCQNCRPHLSGATYQVIKSLAANPVDIKGESQPMRDQLLDIGHSRTPAMLARLIATARNIIRIAVEDGAISKDRGLQNQKEAEAAIRKAGSNQQHYLEDADPVDIFFNTLRQVMASGGGHFRSMNGGIPSVAAQVGWTGEEGMGELPTFKARGPVIGWISPKDNAAYLDANVGYNVIRKAAGNDLPLTRQTLFKRLKDAGKLLRVEDTRERNTVRVTADGHPRTALALPLSDMIEIVE